MENDSVLTNLESIFDQVFEQFVCSICLNELKNTCTTRCGHRFCEECIEKSLNQFKKCPECNTPLKPKEFVKDLIFDSLIAEMKRMRDRKMQSMINKLLDAVNSETQEKYDFKSPLQLVLKDHLIKTLILHENHLSQIRGDFNNRIQNLEGKLIIEKATIERTFPESLEIETNKSELNNRINKEIGELKKEFGKQVKSVAEKYATYLEYSQMSPYNLPVRLKLRVLPKDLRLSGPELKPNQDLNFVIEFLKKQFEKRNEKIVEIPKDLIVLNLGPFANLTNDEVTTICRKYLDNGELPRVFNVFRPQDFSDLLIQKYFIKPESEFVFFGKFVFESELDKRCFRYTFDKSKPIIVDYFECDDCKLKWICKFCKDVCHKDHKFVKPSWKHKPEYACCNCHKKDDCCKLIEIK